MVIVLKRATYLRQELGSKNLGAEMQRCMGSYLLGFSLHVSCHLLCLALL